MSADEAPTWFWKLIEDAAGDRERFRALAAELPRADLLAAFDWYRDLASLVTSDELDEDSAVDVANWIVAQGKAYFFDVHEERRPIPDKVLTRSGIGFLGALNGAFADRYGIEITDDAARE